MTLEEHTTEEQLLHSDDGDDRPPSSTSKTRSVRSLRALNRLLLHSELPPAVAPAWQLC
jgi:hypothetical protein